MTFITFDGSSATNEYLLPPTSHLVLHHAVLTDELMLAEYDEKPYEKYPTGWSRANGRSLLGAIRVQGNNWLKDVWECNFHVVQAQVDLFHLLLQAQQGGGAVMINDYWVGGPISKSVWLEVDRQYLTTIATGQWYRLQFQLWEV